MLGMAYLAWTIRLVRFLARFEGGAQPELGSECNSRHAVDFAPRSVGFMARLCGQMASRGYISVQI